MLVMVSTPFCRGEKRPVCAPQLPMFELFGSPDGQKRRVVYDTGHNIPRPELIKESLDWLDKYLGKTQE